MFFGCSPSDHPVSRLNIYSQKTLGVGIEESDSTRNNIGNYRIMNVICTLLIFVCSASVVGAFVNFWTS